jgi:hypothetical protein
MVDLGELVLLCSTSFGQAVHDCKMEVDLGHCYNIHVHHSVIVVSRRADTSQRLKSGLAPGNGALRALCFPEKHEV